MQFRRQANKIQCIRATYDSQTKTSPQKVIVSFPSYLREAPPEAIALLTEPEREQLLAFIAARQEKARDDLACSAVNRLGEKISRGAMALLAVSITTGEADAIWAGMSALSKALKKAGHPRPQKPAAAPAVAPGQQSLIEQSSV